MQNVNLIQYHINKLERYLLSYKFANYIFMQDSTIYGNNELQINEDLYTWYTK